MLKLLSLLTRVGYALALCLALVACNLPGMSEARVVAEAMPQPAGAWIDAPLSGAEAPPATAIKVIGHVDPAVGQAILYINGANSGLPSIPILNKKPPAYEWEWIPDQPGVYDLRVGGAAGPLSSIVRVTITGEMAYRARFWADQTTLRLGECTALHWETENALQVRLQGAEVEPQGNLGVCPQQDETHVLSVEYKDNHREELTVNLTVLVDTLTPTMTATAPPTVTVYVPPPIVTTVAPPPIVTTVAPPLIVTTVAPPPIITTVAPLPIVTTPAPAPPGRITIVVPPPITLIVPPRDTTPPPAPSGLSPCGARSTPTYVAASPVNLTWYPVQDPSGVAQYKIVLTNIVTKQTNTYYTASTAYSAAIQIGTYAWQVSAQDGAGNWGAASQVCYFYYDVLK